MRLNRFLAEAGITSRRKADELIGSGKIKINGKIVKELGTKIDTEKDKVFYKGRKVEIDTKKNYLILNKPIGFTCTHKDRFAEKTIFELLPKELKGLKYAGRLDKNTSGLVLLSDDGDFIQKITHPKNKIEKEYFVRTNKILSENEKGKLEKGVRLEKKKTSPAQVLKNKGKSFHLIIHEGMKRQVRLMCRKIGHEVLELKRLRIGKIRLGNLEEKKYRPLTKEELEQIS